MDANLRKPLSLERGLPVDARQGFMVVGWELPEVDASQQGSPPFAEVCFEVGEPDTVFIGLRGDVPAELQPV